ncbi:MAG: hypothetical protein R3F59_19300 [Myxococcota bacterium]
MAPPPPVAPPPAPLLPAGWTATLVPASEVLTAEVRCEVGAQHTVWRPDGTFEVVRPDAKYGGTWKLVDNDIVYVTSGPMAPRCSAARYLRDGDRIVGLLCGEGPMSCGGQHRWTVEVVDAGAGPEAVEAAARALATLEGSALGEGWVVAGPPRARPLRDTVVRFRSEDGAARRLAERVAAVLGPVTLRPDPASRSPVLVEVGAPRELPSP